MKLLFLGDIYGRPGRRVVSDVLPVVRSEMDVDFVIANAENLSGGRGFLPKHISDMKEAGVDFFTSGNHAWDQKEGVEALKNSEFPVLRPANYPEDEGVPGDGYRLLEVGGKKLLVINLMGRVFMKLDLDCPFKKADAILSSVPDADWIFIDFHAEATSEKIALAHYLDGRISALVGTHTHVPTADYRVLSGGTAVMCDAGMNGCVDSVIGMKKENSIKHFLSQLPARNEPADEGVMAFSGILIELDSESHKALNVQHILKYL